MSDLKCFINSSGFQYQISIEAFCAVIALGMGWCDDPEAFGKLKPKSTDTLTAYISDRFNCYHSIRENCIYLTDGEETLKAQIGCEENGYQIWDIANPRNVTVATCGYCFRDYDITLCRKIDFKYACPVCRGEFQRAKALNNCKEYLAMRQLATPKWAKLSEIQKVYNCARALTMQTGIAYEVDHIIPIRGRIANGLHVEWNLQIITANENRRKSNKLI